MHTFIRRSMQVSQNANMPNQSLTFQKRDKKANPILGIHIAGLKGPNNVIAERTIVIAE